MTNLVTLPQPQQPVVDPSTGLITPEWWRFFHDPVFSTISVASGESGGVLAFISDTELVSSGSLSKFGLVLGGGPGATPTATAAGTDGQIPVGQTNLAPLFKTISGDASLAKTGALTVTKTNGTPFTAYATASIGQLPGTATNDSAVAGNIGEYVSASVAVGSAVPLATGTTANVTSISLTAGDWDVEGVVDYTFGATTNYTALQQGISTTSATLGSQDTFSSEVTAGVVPTGAVDAAVPTPRVRVSIAGTTTVYLVTKAAFTVSTLAAYGTIRARRVR